MTTAMERFEEAVSDISVPSRVRLQELVDALGIIVKRSPTGQMDPGVMGVWIGLRDLLAASPTPPASGDEVKKLREACVRGAVFLKGYSAANDYINVLENPLGIQSDSLAKIKAAYWAVVHEIANFPTPPAAGQDRYLIFGWVYGEVFIGTPEVARRFPAAIPVYTREPTPEEGK